ncbi:hypothetical protein AN958_00113 [Leucoagaricus sp. SymC.cos]|nr:hypothetical protein AN958_00113 [Leucoagaricus sp. SymC.cos]
MVIGATSLGRLITERQVIAGIGKISPEAPTRDIHRDTLRLLKNGLRKSRDK